MSKKKKNIVVKYDTDRLVVNLFHQMVKDFQAVHGTAFAVEANSALAMGVKDFRRYVFPDYSGTTVPRFRAWYQLENFFKKYRFRNDLYDDQQLEKMTIEKYLSRQVELAAPRRLTHRAFLVFKEARRIAQAILGPFDADRSLNLSRFGKNSSIGCPFSMSYLDIKLTSQEAHTGSAAGIKSFYEDYLPGDPLLSRILREKGLERPDSVESLPLILVPKTWKALRGITPLSLLTLFRTYGIGELITERLESAGLPIKRLQQIHRRAIRRFSETRSHVTMDLSAASDSITSEILQRILPRQWYREVIATTSRQLCIEGRSYYTSSILPMGNGLTFPLETLVFYSLIQAVGNLTGVRGMYSVYGDDLIFPRPVYKKILAVFNDIGLAVNVDKTFASSFFRESCGADYLAGVDVRPAFVPSGGLLTRSQYGSWLYKLLNSLLRRWDPREIPSVVNRILIELTVTMGEIFRVPPSFPDTAGLKVQFPGEFLTSYAEFLPWSPVVHAFEHGTRRFAFKYFVATGPRRAVVSVEPYYWDTLRNPDGVIKDDFPPRAEDEWHEGKRSPITWRCERVTRKFRLPNGDLVEKKRKKFTPEVPVKISGRFKIQGIPPGIIFSDWI